MNQPRKTTLHRIFILGITTILCLFMRASAQHPTTLPGENGQKPAIQYDYFPSRQHAFVWRNWTLVPAEKLARVLGTSKRNVERLAESMGLNRKQRIEEEWGTSRGYITIVRRNWHLLPYEQLLMLLNMSREELAYRLIEDDFLWTKLGKVKPKCEPLTYTEPDKHTQEKAARFAKDVQNYVQAAQYPSESRFGFMREFDKVKKNRVHSTLPTVSDRRYVCRLTGRREKRCRAEPSCEVPSVAIFRSLPLRTTGGKALLDRKTGPCRAKDRHNP